MEAEGIRPQNMGDTSVEEPVNPSGGATEAKTRISLVFTVTNPTKEADRWDPYAIWHQVARTLSLMGANDLTFEDLALDNLESADS